MEGRKEEKMTGEVDVKNEMYALIRRSDDIFCRVDM